MTNTAEYKDFAVALAREAGAIMRKHFGIHIAVESKADGAPLTIADTTINQLVMDRISTTYPDFGIITEEAPEVKTNSLYTWVCDPLDGTLPFSCGIPVFTFSLALCENGTPIVGVVYDPMMDRLFTAEKGKGAWLNEKTKLEVSKLPFSGSIASVASLTMGPYGNNLKSKYKLWAPHFYSFVASAMQVALGNFTAARFDWTTPWDGAAVAIIVREAGGRVTNDEGKDQRYDRPILGVVATNGVVHDEVLALIREYAVR